MFGMGMVCEKATYRGTATPMQGGQLPGLGSGKHPDLWWFACQAKGEGSQNYFTIGWTSGDVAWLVDAPDEDTSRELLDVMIALTLRSLRRLAPGPTPYDGLADAITTANAR